jgi:hypothetical protein
LFYFTDVSFFSSCFSFQETIERYGPKKEATKSSLRVVDPDCLLNIQPPPVPHHLDTPHDLINLLHLRPKEGDAIVDIDLSLLGLGVNSLTNDRQTINSNNKSDPNATLSSNNNNNATIMPLSSSSSLASLQQQLNQAVASVAITPSTHSSSPSSSSSILSHEATTTPPPDSIRSLHLETKNKGNEAALLFSSTQTDLVQKTVQGEVFFF